MIKNIYLGSLKKKTFKKYNFNWSLVVNGKWILPINQWLNTKPITGYLLSRILAN